MQPEEQAAAIVREMRGDYSEDRIRKAVRDFGRMLREQAPQPADPRQINWLTEACHG